MSHPIHISLRSHRQRVLGCFVLLLTALALLLPLAAGPASVHFAPAAGHPTIGQVNWGSSDQPVPMQGLPTIGQVNWGSSDQPVPMQGLPTIGQVNWNLNGWSA